MNNQILYSIIAIVALNIIENKVTHCWEEMIKKWHVEANVVQLFNYFPLRNSTYDPFFFHTDILQSDR